MKLISRTASLAGNAWRGLLFGLGIAFVVHFIVWYLGPALPTLDANTEAYIYVLEGLKAGHYAKAKEMFDWAYSTTDDPELRYVADYNSRQCDLFLKAGVTSFEETGTMGANMKALEAGFTQPLNGISALGQLIEVHLGDYQNDCSIVDERYHQKIHDYWTAIQTRKSIYYILLFAPPVVSAVLFFIYARSQRRSHFTHEQKTA